MPDVESNGNLAIEVNDLSKRFGQIVAVDQISFEVKRGEAFGFLGPNGAGKTTTIRMLTGLSKPSSGKARILGLDISSEIVKAKKCFGEVPELSNMYDELSGFQNLVFAGQLYGIPASGRKERAIELLKIFGLYEKKDARFSTYSRGMKRALTVAAALVHRPQILFLDEPTVGLDVAAARSLRALIERLHEQGVTVFLTTHYLEEADHLCDRIALLVKGKVVAVETPARLKAMAEEEPAIDVQWKSEMPDVVAELGQLLPGTRVVRLAERIRIYSGNPAQILEAIISYSHDRGIDIASVNSVKPSLEDAFVKLTGISPVVLAAEKGKK
jgi:ABC-2 type transport system ATP-binding protein